MRLGKSMFRCFDSRTWLRCVYGAASICLLIFICIHLRTPTKGEKRQFLLSAKDYQDKQWVIHGGKQFGGIEEDKSTSHPRTFKVKGDIFEKDGQAFSFRAGSAHYWRRMPEYWEDTMIKLKALGLNALQTYISWNLHEPEPGQYDFSGGLDFFRYLRLAEKYGLLVIVRPGPFINAEMEMGGFPYWLLGKNPSIRLRTRDALYMKYVTKWFRKLLPMLVPFLYENGGPIIMVQMENEYGSYFACDRDYLLKLRDLARSLLPPSTVLYTTDGPTRRMLQCGTIPQTLSTVDFGGGNDASLILTDIRQDVPSGPFVNSEFYPGWINHWGRPWNFVRAEPVLMTLKSLLELNASFTFYPAVGGTNFGFLVGANHYKEGFFPGTTSYDFNAPISEAGDVTDKFRAIQNVLRQLGFVGDLEIPANAEKGAYGSVEMKFAGTLFDNLKSLSTRPPYQSSTLGSFEQLEQPFGFMLYRTDITSKSRLASSSLTFDCIHDQAFVFVDQELVGRVSRSDDQQELVVSGKGGVLDVLVHNEGRITAGPFINDSKGILGEVWLDKTKLLGWQHFPIDLPSYPVKKPRPLPLQSPLTTQTSPSNDAFVPSFFQANFSADLPLDTFLKLDGWGQGYAFINGYNLGRYWPSKGPQLTLYIPGAMLRESGENVLQLLELERSPCHDPDTCTVKFVDSPVVGESIIYKHPQHSYDKPFT